MRCLIYTRVSTEDQARGYSLDGQERELRAEAAKHTWAVLDLISDTGSGDNWDLPGLLQVLARAQQAEYDILLVLDMSRLSRSLGKFVFVREKLRELGIEIRYVREQYAPTAEGTLQQDLMASFADYEKSKIAYRMRLGKQQKQRLGRPVGAHRTPYGYLPIKDPLRKATMGYAPHPEQAPVVAAMFRQALASSDWEIARRLNVDGIAAPNAAWRDWTVAQILQRRTYRGDYHYGKESEALPVPALVDAELWEAVQHARAGRKNRPGRSRMAADADPYSLRGLVTCGLCGSPLACQANRKQRYYTCLNSHPRRAEIRRHERCTLGWVHAPELENLIWERIVAHPEKVQELFSQMRDEVSGGTTNAKRATILQAQIEKLRKRLERATVEKLDADPDSPTYAALAAAIKQTDRDLAQLSRDLQALEDAPPTLTVASITAAQEIYEKHTKAPEHRRGHTLRVLRPAMLIRPGVDHAVGRRSFNIIVEPLRLSPHSADDIHRMSALYLDLERGSLSLAP